MPEEINRVVTDALADLLLTPSSEAGLNLRREGIPESRIRLVGNIMIDTLTANLSQARAAHSARIGLAPKAFAYVTLHRPSNVDNPQNLAAIMAALGALACAMPVVFPMHPRTRKRLAQFGLAAGANGALKILEPVGYRASLCLTENARLVLTDSGGLQEESTFFKVPCLTLRPNTERPVTLSLGSNKLTRLDRLQADLDEAIHGPRKLGRIPPLWDGKAARRIVEAIVRRSS